MGLLYYDSEPNYIHKVKNKDSINATTTNSTSSSHTTTTSFHSLDFNRKILTLPSSALLSVKNNCVFKVGQTLKLQHKIVTGLRTFILRSGYVANDLGCSTLGIKWFLCCFFPMKFLSFDCNWIVYTRWLLIWKAHGLGKLMAMIADLILPYIWL